MWITRLGCLSWQTTKGVKAMCSKCYPVGTRLVTAIDIKIRTIVVPAGMHGTVTYHDPEEWLAVSFDQPIEAIEHWQNCLVVDYEDLKTQFKFEDAYIQERRAEALSHTWSGAEDDEADAA
jgi:hypothetical protein